MMLLHDRTTMARALTLSLEPRLHALLADRIAALTSGEHDLTDWTEFLIIEAGDTEADIIREIGFSPLVNPIDGISFPDPGFEPGWDMLISHDGWFEMIVTFGSTFACILLIENAGVALPGLLTLCRRFAVLASSGQMKPDARPRDPSGV